MATINVVKAFTFNHGEGKLQRYEVGPQEVEEAFAEHWYVKAHLAQPEPEKPVEKVEDGIDVEEILAANHDLANKLAAVQTEIERLTAANAELQAKLDNKPAGEQNQQGDQQQEPEATPKGGRRKQQQ